MGALGHWRWSMAEQAGTSFIAFALLGWAAHSPSLASALSVGPALHFGVIVYDHVVAPVTNGALGIILNSVSRKHEYEADAFSAKLSERRAEALQTALAKLNFN